MDEKLVEELIKAFTKKISEGPHKNNVTINVTKPEQDITKAIKDTATTTKRFYDAYLEAGFTTEQAFELTKIAATPAKKG